MINEIRKIDGVFEVEWISHDGYAVRQIITDDVPMLVLKDVCGYLGIKHASTVAKRIHYDNKAEVVLNHLSSNGVVQRRNITVINASGYAEVVDGSRKAKARPFKDWLRGDVAADVINNGSYAIPTLDKLRGNDDEILKLIAYTTETVAQRNELVVKTDGMANRIEELEEVIETDKPRVLLAKSRESQDDWVLIEEMSHMITQIGYYINWKTLFAELKRDGYLIKRRGGRQNQPTMKSIKNHWIMLCDESYFDNDGKEHFYTIPKVTVDGQKHLLKRYARRLDKEQKQKEDSR